MFFLSNSEVRRQETEADTKMMQQRKRGCLLSRFFLNMEHPTLNFEDELFSFNLAITCGRRVLQLNNLYFFSLR